MLFRSIRWAADRVDPIVIDFIRQNPVHLRVDPGKVESGTVCPNPASWARLDESLRHMGMTPTEVAGSRPDGFYALSQGFVGTEAAIAFTEFVAKYETQISADDVLSGKITDAKAKTLKASESLAVLDKLIDAAGKDKWTTKGVANLVKFVRCLPGEQLVHLWNGVMGTKNMGAIKMLHTHVGNRSEEHTSELQSH